MTEVKLLAAALYQLRVSLAPFGGPDADLRLIAAAGLAYALHSDALDVLQDKSFNCEDALARIEKQIGGEEGRRIAGCIRGAISN